MGIQGSGRRVAGIFAAFLAALAILVPEALASGPGRGARLEIRLKDGHEVWGELIAVRPEALLVLDPGGVGRSVALPDIATIRLPRRSKAWQGLVIGFAAGAVGGAIWGYHQADDDMAELGALFGGTVVGAAAGLVGLAVGLGAGLDLKIDWAGTPDAERPGVLARLNRVAREPERGLDAAPVGRRAGTTGRQTRFRLTWWPGVATGGRGFFVERGTVPFIFTEDLPPGEAGPYQSTDFWSNHLGSRRFVLGRLTASYQWSPRFGAEIEFYEKGAAIDQLGYLVFTSSLDGLEHGGHFSGRETTSATALLLGLSFKPLPPALFRPDVIEVGAAVGPAFVRTTESVYPYPRARAETVDRRTKWTARARLSYDHYFAPSFSMGAFGEYRWLKANVPSHAVNADLEFSAPDRFLVRATELRLPAQTIDLGGFAFGLRFGVGF